MKLNKICAAVLAAVICAGLFAGCAGKSDNKDVAETTVTTAAEVAVSGTVTFDDLLEGMTSEEIEAVYKDLEDLGLTEDDIIAMLNGQFNEAELTSAE